ncbi:ADP-ribose pyrophosphatase, mitochondrial [Erpetoichthys calabaricus]|uniref:ADP-ribose pyrophosphatase, mitochondrial n=1 Tax=Erpetoichthys calabaricus TaxID=27687 RepID=UPI00223446B6|nr:ADP-ribose pyrophosphatase, mitochondrial [Erpetoichthys calabaricus]
MPLLDMAAVRVRVRLTPHSWLRPPLARPHPTWRCCTRLWRAVHAPSLRAAAGGSHVDSYRFLAVTRRPPLVFGGVSWILGTPWVMRRTKSGYVLGLTLSVLGSCWAKDNRHSACVQLSTWLHQSTSANTCAMSPPHVKARCPVYPGSDIRRFPVPDEKVNWKVAFVDYKPIPHTDETVKKRPVWADPEIGEFSPKFNHLDGKVDRQSYEGQYQTEKGYPRNPHGRTGITGRGLLGRWGPNHAGDPIITRWKRDRDSMKVLHSHSGKPILQFVSIRRKDCGEWAIPGGMVDAGEKVSITLRREFGEEALNLLQKSGEERKKLKEQLRELFSKPAFKVYEGYVDDPRNTDNAWMETVAMNFHDDSGSCMDQIPLEAGDDAGKVKWVDIDGSLHLYASHLEFIKATALHHHAHWH